MKDSTNLERGDKVSETSSTGVNVDEAMADVCRAVGRFIEYWGFKANHGQVWTLIVLSNRPLAQKDLVARLSLSRGTISAVCSDLVERELIEPVSAHRNSPYIARQDFWSTVASVLRSREASLIEETGQALRRLIRALERQSSAGEPVHFDVRKARMLLTLTDVADRFVQLIINFPIQNGSEYVTHWSDTVGRVTSRLRDMLTPKR